MTIIEQIKAEIERLKEINKRTLDGQLKVGCLYALNQVLSFLSTLEKECGDFPTTDEEMAKFLATHPKVEVPEKYKTPDWMFEKSEKPMNQDGLQEEIARTYHDGSVADTSNIDHVSYENIAEYFYELGCRRTAEKYDDIEYNRQRAEEEMPLPEDTVLFNKGVAEGRRLAEEEQAELLTIAHLQGADQMKKQMIEEAVEGEVVLNPYPTICLDDCKDYDFKDGDKVRVIVIPNTDEK